MNKEQIASILSDANINNVRVLETGLQRCPVQVTLVVQPDESQQDQFARLDAIEAALQQVGVQAWAKATCVSMHGWLPAQEDED